MCEKCKSAQKIMEIIKMENKIRFERKIINMGDSKGLTIPTEVMNYLGNPESVFIMPDKSKHGVFIAIYSTKQKEQKIENKMVEEEPWKDEP